MWGAGGGSSGSVLLSKQLCFNLEEIAFSLENFVQCFACYMHAYQLICWLVIICLHLTCLLTCETDDMTSWFNS